MQNTQKIALLVFIISATSLVYLGSKYIEPKEPTVEIIQKYDEPIEIKEELLYGLEDKPAYNTTEEVGENNKEIEEIEELSNEDLVGYLYIPSLNIAEYVYYTGDNYYLNHNKDKNKDSAGEVYIDGRSDMSIYSPYKVFNGHNMMDGTKFGNLSDIYKLDLNEPTYIYYDDYKVNTTITYQVFAITNIKSKDFFPVFNFTNDFKKQEYIKGLYENSSAKLNPPNYINSVITLNTCSSPRGSEHLLVSAQAVKWEDIK